MKLSSLMMLIMASIFISLSAFSEKVEVIKGGYIRSGVDVKDNQGWAKPGQVFEVLEKIGSWHYVEVVSDSIHVGSKGWVWRKLYTDNKILGKGAILHTIPGKNSPEVCRVKGGAGVKLIKKDVKWYKIAVNKLIFHSYVKLIE